MAKQIIWSSRADNDRIQIFEYWNNRNKSKIYSKKLNELFNSAVELIANYSSIGRATTVKNIKIKVVKDYLVIYEDTPELIIVLSVWDSRRNPDEFEKLLTER